MSNSLLETVAAMLQGSSAPKEQKAITQGSAQLLRNLLFQKQYSDNQPLLVDGSSLRDESGEEITYGDLKFRLENAERPNGTFGPHYPNIYALSQAQGKAAIDWLQQQPAKQAGGNNFRPKAGKTNSAPQQASANAEVAELKEIVMLLLQQQLGGQSAEPTVEPAKPVVASGFVKATSAKAEVPSAAIEINVGDVVSINGQLRQVVEGTNGAFRLNKTIV